MKIVNGASYKWSMIRFCYNHVIDLWKGFSTDKRNWYKSVRVFTGFVTDLGKKIWVMTKTSGKDNRRAWNNIFSKILTGLVVGCVTGASDMTRDKTCDRTLSTTCNKDLRQGLCYTTGFNIWDRTSGRTGNIDLRETYVIETSGKLVPDDSWDRLVRDTYRSLGHERKTCCVNWREGYQRNPIQGQIMQTWRNINVT